MKRRSVEAVHEGAAGAICGLANVYPELVCSLYTQEKVVSMKSLKT